LASRLFAHLGPRSVGHCRAHPASYLRLCCTSYLGGLLSIFFIAGQFCKQGRKPNQSQVLSVSFKKENSC
jgi:hypothetical protein